jgi:hypothetical protein
VLVKKSGVLCLVSSQIVIVRETSLVSTFHSQKQHFSHRNRPFESSFSLLAPSGLRSRPADRSHSSRSQPFGLVSQHRDPDLTHATFYDWSTTPSSPRGPLFSPHSLTRGQPITHHSLLATEYSLFFHPILLCSKCCHIPSIHKTKSWNYSHQKKSPNWSACEILENFTGH